MEIIIQNKQKEILYQTPNGENDYTMFSLAQHMDFILIDNTPYRIKRRLFTEKTIIMEAHRVDIDDINKVQRLLRIAL